MYLSIAFSLITAYLAVSVLFLCSLWLCRKLTRDPLNGATTLSVIMLLCWMVCAILLSLVLLGSAISLLLTGPPLAGT